MSGKRNVVFSNEEFYHVFNRTTANEQVFVRKKETRKALDLLSFYKFEQTLRFSFFNRLQDEEKTIYWARLGEKNPIVDIYAYALMPNHFHLLLKQRKEKGIQSLLSNFQNSFAKYFNIKNKRFGALFQRPFKAKHISTDDELLHISRYIHLNPVTSHIMNYEDLKKSNLTSFPFYLIKKKSFVDTDFIIKIIGSYNKYEKFVANQIDYQRKLNKIKHLLLE